SRRPADWPVGNGDLKGGKKLVHGAIDVLSIKSLSDLPADSLPSNCTPFFGVQLIRHDEDPPDIKRELGSLYANQHAHPCLQGMPHRELIVYVWIIAAHIDDGQIAEEYGS